MPKAVARNALRYVAAVVPAWNVAVSGPLMVTLPAMPGDTLHATLSGEIWLLYESYPVAVNAPLAVTDSVRADGCMLIVASAPGTTVMSA